jgi:L,D-transpeptidase catalytic domain
VPEPGAPGLHGLKPEHARRRLRRRAVVLVLLAPLALSAPAAAETAPGVAAGEPLSDERTFTRWAHSQLRAPIRRLPAPTSQRIARVRHLTEHGFPEVYLVLRGWTDPDGRAWLKVRIPMHPNGREGWVRDSALGRLQLVRTRLVVDRRRLRAALYRSGRRIWRSRIGIGKPSTPTPAGRFWIRESIKVPDPSGTYGPWAFGTSAYSGLSGWPGGGVIGIHGTNQPYLIPGRPSHGCIRIANRAIRRLARLMPIGTPVRIR